MGDTSLTDEQKDFLAQCEEEFKDRYTDKDEEFMKIRSAERSKPPIVDPWYNKPRRPHYDWSRGRDHGERRNHSHDRRKNERNHERNDRYAIRSDRNDAYKRKFRPY